ncbi:Uncharacterised protein [Vibrio cholerae]|nr:Uncharacterised protein [Vibrio cholerae]
MPFITVLPSDTCPSPAMTTLLLRRTDTIVVTRGLFNFYRRVTRLYAATGKQFQAKREKLTECQQKSLINIRLLGSRLLLFSPDSAGLDFCALQFVLIALSIALKFVRSEDDTIPTAVRFLTDMAADALESDIQLTRFGLFCGFIRTTLHHVRDIRHFLLFGPLGSGSLLSKYKP